MNTSMHEINWRIKKIGERNGREQVFQASLFGYDLKMEKPRGNEPVKDISDEDAKRLMEEAHARRIRDGRKFSNSN